LQTKSDFFFYDLSFPDIDLGNIDSKLLTFLYQILLATRVQGNNLTECNNRFLHYFNIIYNITADDI